MTRVADNDTDVVLLGKAQGGCDVCGALDLDRVADVVSEHARL